MMSIKKILLGIPHYIIGKIRYFLFKRKYKNIDFNYLVSISNNWEDVNDNASQSHTTEQFLYRLHLVNLASPACITNKACVSCQCDTPDLFFANKSCDRKCYPVMMNKKEWQAYKIDNKIDMLKILSNIKHLL